MDEFPGNSNKEKRVEKRDPKKVNKVVEGEVIRRKQPLGTRFKNMFLGADAKSVGGYVVLDVIIPAAKDMVFDSLTTGVEQMLFGEVRSGNRRGPARYANRGNEKTDYGRYSKTDSRPSTRLSRSDRANHNFDELILPSRHEADAVIDGMYAILEKYDVVTVGDLYGLCDEPSEYTDDDWGWTDLRGAGVQRIRSGYLLVLPRTEPLSKR